MTRLAETWEQERGALVIAHPGHELCIHHWLERARPVTFVLTDGSGHGERARIDSTTTVLERAGATPGEIYGALSDRQLYQAILSGERELFTALTVKLSDALLRHGITYVVGDAVEGVNPGHDVCRLLLNAALRHLEKNSGTRVINLEYPVERPPDQCPPEDRAEAIWLNLDDAAYQRKVEAARAYRELAGDLTLMVALHNMNAFRVECLRPVRYELDIAGRFTEPCLYEWYGEKQVAAGVYRDVIRFRQHVAPLAEGLNAYLDAA